MSKLVCVPMQEIMETPGIFDALRGEKVRWTLRLRAMLEEKGLDAGDSAQVYEMRAFDKCNEWWFCNAASPREAHDVFYGEVASRSEARRKYALEKYAREAKGV